MGSASRLLTLIVLGGCAGVEKAAKDAGHDVQVPFTPGRTDASQEQTDVESFAVLEPTADGFRDYFRGSYTKVGRGAAGGTGEPADADRPEMTVLVGGMRVLNANVGQSELGVFTKRPGTLTNDFFVNLLDVNTEWKTTSASVFAFANSTLLEDVVRGTRSRDRRTQVDRHQGRPRLRFELQLRAIAEVYACADSQQAFVRDFVAAWDKVMNLDRFDVA